MKPSGLPCETLVLNVNVKTFRLALHIRHGKLPGSNSYFTSRYYYKALHPTAYSPSLSSLPAAGDLGR